MRRIIGHGCVCSSALGAVLGGAAGARCCARCFVVGSHAPARATSNAQHRHPAAWTVEPSGSTPSQRIKRKQTGRKQRQYSYEPAVHWSLYSASMCQPEIPVQQRQPALPPILPVLVSICSKRFHRDLSRKPALRHRHFRGTSTNNVYVPSHIVSYIIKNEKTFQL